MRHPLSRIDMYMTYPMLTSHTILNGRTLGDLSGSFTSINHNGCSVIDYFATTPILYSQVSLLEVHALNHFSDHCPLQLTLKTNHLNLKVIKPLHDMFDPAPNRLFLMKIAKPNLLMPKKVTTNALNI